VLLLLSAPGLPPGALRGVWIALGVLALAGPTTMVALRGVAWRRAQRPAPSRWLARLTPSRWRVETADGPKAGWLNPVVEPLLGIGSTWRVAPHDLGLAAMSCACLCVSNAFALEAVGAGAPPFQAAAALVMAGFVGTVAGTVGGIGATELALIGFLGRMDVPPEAAAAGALLHRSAYYAVSLGLGGIALLLEGQPADAAGS
jgi:uncharacterized membrane protein YbhN (UPF0104 family)